MPLKNSSLVAIVDDDLYETLSSLRWSLWGGKGYVRTTGQVDGERLLHRIVNRTPKGFETDHKNRNKLDNRRENLKTSTRSGNELNKGITRKNKTGVLGVFLDKYGNRKKKWRASAGIVGYKVMIGRFETQEGAAAAFEMFSRNIASVDESEITPEIIKQWGGQVMGKRYLQNEEKIV